MASSKCWRQENSLAEVEISLVTLDSSLTIGAVYKPAELEEIDVIH